MEKTVCKCDTCVHAMECMNFFCDETTHYKDYQEQPPEPWRIENIRIQYNVIIPA